MVCAGCGGGGGGHDGGAPTVEAGSMAEESGQSASPYCTDKPAVTSVTDLSGTWVARVTGSQIVNAPLVGKIHNENVFYLLVTFSQTGAAVSANGHYCDRAQLGDPGALMSVVVPDAWAHFEKVVNRMGTFSPGADGTMVLSLPPVTEFAGAVLATASEALPVKPDDPRVIDEDNDGNPGITIRVSGLSLSGSLYAVQRQTTTIQAIVVARDRLEGALTFTSEQVVLGSDSPTIAGLYSQSTTTPDFITCNSGFAMVRVGDAAGVDGGAMDGGGAINCAWVRANETALFP